jgi:hypothetical protein
LLTSLEVLRIICSTDVQLITHLMKLCLILSLERIHSFQSCVNIQLLQVKFFKRGLRDIILFSKLKMMESITSEVFWLKVILTENELLLINLHYIPAKHLD